jgi:hypothetical protein
MNGLVCSQGQVNDVWIEGIEIDGSCAELNKDLANTFGHDKDCERGIIINGATNNFCNNITIKKVKVYDTFSDGVHIRFANNVRVIDSTFSNNQHEGCYFVCVRNGLMQRIEVAGITSDDARMDNCEYSKDLNCTFFSYTGPNNNGAWKGHQNGIQISDQGFSHGAGSDKSGIIHTNNIEVAYCTFANMGRPIWLDSTGKGMGDNIYIHDNKGVDLETMGISVPDDISSDNPPTIEQSEQVFSSIFDILNFDFITGGLIGNKTIYVNGTLYDSSKTPENLIMTLEQHELGNQSYTLLYGPSEGLTQFKVECGGKKAVHTLMIGENRGNGIFYSNCSMWSGNIYRIGDSFYLDGIIEPKDIDVTCYTVAGSLNPDFEVVKVEQEHKGVFDKFIFLYLSILLVLLSIPVMVVYIIFSKRF